MIKNIIFDLGGVLLDLDMPYCITRFKSLGLDLNKLTESNKNSTSASTQKNAVLCEGMVATGAMNLYQTGDISTDDFFLGMQRYALPGTTMKQLKDAWNTCCLTIPQYRLDKVYELRQKGYNIYMLSNTNDEHWQDIVARCFGSYEDVTRYFHRTFLSQEMHLAKPNDAIYTTLLSEINAEASECLFIDDSQPNIDAASALGFHTIKAQVTKTKDGEVIERPSIDWVNIIDERLA